MDFFELNSWSLKGGDVRAHAFSAFSHSVDFLLSHHRPSSWPTGLVDPFHLFACGTTRSGAMAKPRQALGILLSQGDNLDAIDASGWTPLCYAAWFGQSRTLDVLLEAGAQVNPAEGPMPLAVALSSVAQRKNQGSSTCAKLLLMSGADPQRCTISDATGRSSYLSWALATENMEWANILHARGDTIRSERELATLAWQAGPEALDWLDVHGYEVLSRLPRDHPNRHELFAAQSRRRHDALTEIAEAVRPVVLVDNEDDPRKL